MDALAARQHRPGGEADLAEHVAQLQCGFLDLFEAEPFVGIEIEDETIGHFDVGDLRSPAVKFDAAHLDAGEHAPRVVDIEIGFGRAVLLADRHMLDGIAEIAAVMLLEEALLGAALRAAHQADRAIGEPYEDRVGEALVIIRELALGDAAFGEDDAVGVGDGDGGSRRADCAFFERAAGFTVVPSPRPSRPRGEGVSRGSLRFQALSSLSAMKLGMPQHAVVGHFGEGDFGDQFRRDPVRAAHRRARRLDRSGLAFERFHPLAADRPSVFAPKPVPTLPA
jgi:hypothetical protein